MKPTPIHVRRAALAVAAYLCAAGVAASAADRDAVPLIVLDNVPLVDVIRNLARQSGGNFTLDPRVAVASQPYISARWTNMSAHAALSAVLKDYKLTMVTNPATTVARIAPTSLGVKPVPASQVGTNTSGVIPLLVMDDEPLTKAITNLASHAQLKVSLDPRLLPTASGREVTVSFAWKNITVRQALAALLDNYDLILIEEPAAASARITVKTRAGTEPAGKGVPERK